MQVDPIIQYTNDWQIALLLTQNDLRVEGIHVIIITWTWEISICFLVRHISYIEHQSISCPHMNFQNMLFTCQSFTTFYVLPSVMHRSDIWIAIVHYVLNILFWEKGWGSRARKPSWSYSCIVVAKKNSVFPTYKKTE